MTRTDILIIGSGIAGLAFAVKTARQFPQKQVTIITKEDVKESNTRYAQGGIAVVQNKVFDSFQRHIADTLRAGDGLCNDRVVEAVVTEGPERLSEIIGWGMDFDRDDKGLLALGMEGGHTANRIVHYKDITGAQIAYTLLGYSSIFPNIRILSHVFAVDLITTQAGDTTVCQGVTVLNRETGSIEAIHAKVTLLATGGCGQVYRVTTNPLIATGDGVAMAYRAGARISDMEFIQFHPTAFYEPAHNPAFLISEAVRGYGAYLRTRDEERFMFRYDSRGELASRDIVARAIYEECMLRGDEFVYLDCRHFSRHVFLSHFPNIYEMCASRGIDLHTSMIPVAPAAHYQCGGIAVDMYGRTSVDNLYACGECACTGLHGANRLASNSLLEALVFAHRCFVEVEKNLEQITFTEATPEELLKEEKQLPPDPHYIAQIRNQLRSLMSEHVAIVRSATRLQFAIAQLKIIEEKIDAIFSECTCTPELCELRNMLTVATLITRHSLARKENRGTFYNADLAVSV